MILVIDGYNVLKQVFLKSMISERERIKFVNQLAKYSKKKGHEVKLVFDGGLLRWPTIEQVGRVSVIYVGAEEIADDYIKRYLADHKFLDILVVSSDQDICNFAKRLNIESIDAKEFYSILLTGLKKNNDQKKVKETKIIKISKQEDEELDKVMEEASKIVDYKAEDFLHSCDMEKIKSKKRSKKDKKKLKQIKKL